MLEVRRLRFGISEKTLRDWEQNRRHSTGPAEVLLAVSEVTHGQKHGLLR